MPGNTVPDADQTTQKGEGKRAPRLSLHSQCTVRLMAHTLASATQAL